MSESIMEPSEVSAAKDIVWSTLEDYVDAEDHDLIKIADTVVNALLANGIQVPESVTSPFWPSYNS